MKRGLAIVAVMLVAGLATAGMYTAVADQQHPMQDKSTATCPMGYKAVCGGCCPTKDSEKPAVKKAPAVVSAVCPVMKNTIPDITKAVGKSVYKGKTYYFCCAGCKPLFDKNPEKYIAPPPAKPQSPK